MPSGLIINGRDLDEYGLKVESATGLTGAVTASVPTVSMTGAFGDIVASPDPQSEPRIVSVPVYLKAASNALLLTAIEELMELLTVGPLELRIPHSSDRFWMARFTGSTLAVVDPVFDPDRLEATGVLSFRLVSALAMERLPRAYSITATGTPGRVYVLLGTGPSRPVIQIRGPATNPKATLLDAFGVPVSEMNFTITLGTNDFLGIDCWSRRVSKSVAGVLSAADSTRKQGDDFFNLLPRYGNRAAGRHVLLEISAGKAVIRVRRSWKL
jgi:hypothetical protein